MYRLETTEKLSEKQLESWKKLWEQTSNSHFFNSPMWFVSYLESQKIEKYQVFFCWKGEKLVGVLPTVSTKKFGVQVLASVQSGQDFLDRSTLLLENCDQEATTFLFQEISNKHNVFLAEVPEKCSEGLKKSADKTMAEFSTISPVAKLKGDVLENMSGKQRKKIRSKIKKFSNQLSFKLFRDDLEDHLQTMITIEKNSHKSAKKISLFDKPEVVKLYQAFVKNGKGNIGIGFLYFDGKPIAHRFGFFVGKTFHSVHIAFLDEHRKIGPGKILTFFFLQELQKRGYEKMDFSVGSNQLKQRFANENPRQFHLFFAKNNFVFVWWKLMLLVKNFVKRLSKDV